MPELLGRHEIRLPPAGTKTNELIGKHVHTTGVVLIYIPVLCNISYDWSVKDTNCSW